MHTHSCNSDVDKKMATSSSFSNPLYLCSQFLLLCILCGYVFHLKLICSPTSFVQNNILKIRKVYDAFLAEFPLCYGYWKKYADHEAHLGSIDKVVEVYERAVQGVTYSVDIWLHYCIFAISTYGDPDTVRR